MAVYRDKRRAKRPWVIDISGTDRRTGKPVRYFRNAKCQTADAARAEERALLRYLAEHGHFPEKSGSVKEKSELSFREAYALYERTAKATLKHSTWVGYQKNIVAYLLPEFGDVRLSGLNRARLIAFDQKLARDGLSPSTRNNIVMPLRSIIRNAVDLGQHEAVPEFPALTKVQQKVFEPPSAEQVAAIVAAAEPHVRSAIALAAYAGLRLSEIIGMRWENVNLETRMLFVREAITHKQVVVPKSGHQRAIPMAAPLFQILEASSFEPYAPESPVSSPSGESRRPWSSEGLRGAFHRALQRAGMPPTRIHDLRHFFITQCFAAGAGGPTVQQLAGHCHLSVTQRYAHTNEALMRQAVQVFGARPADSVNLT